MCLLLLFTFLGHHLSNDAGNSALMTGINYTLLYIHIENTLLLIICYNISKFECISDVNVNASLVSVIVAWIPI